MRAQTIAAALLLAASLPAGPAIAETKEEATADCETRLGFGLGSCACFIDDWVSYSEDTRAFIAAMVKNDKAAEAVQQTPIDKKV